MKKKVFNIPNVGDITISKHNNAKRIILKVKPNELPSVIIPKLMPYKMGLMFAVEKSEWIINSVNKIKNKNDNLSVFTDQSEINTLHSKIKIIRYGDKIRIEKKENIIKLNIPLNYDINLIENQNIIKSIIIDILRLEAKKYLPERTKLLAEKFGFKYNNLFIKNLKSRWGSCSSVNNINLNLHIIRLPEYLSDFIILHELCHTIHKNHGKDFHKLLNTICKGKEKEYDKEIKKYNTIL